MADTSGADATELRRHLDALEAAAALQARRPEEAIGSARRVARALARVGVEFHLAELSAAARGLIEAAGADFRPAFDALIAQLRREIEAASMPRGTVLVIEDDPVPAKLLGYSLTQKGWDVAIAGTAEQAEAILAREPISAIVLDLVLPDADGRNLLVRFKEDPRSEAIPVYVASARSDPHVRTECLALGAEEFFEKPVAPDLLLQLIARRAAVPSARAAEEVAPPIAERRELVSTFRSRPGAVRALALVTVTRRGPGPESTTEATSGDALEPVGRAIAESVEGDVVVARWTASELAVLFHSLELGEAAQQLEAARHRLSESGSGLDFTAGLVAVDPDSELDDAIDEAGHLLYLAASSPGGRILADPAGVRLPEVTILLAEDDEVAAKLVVYRLSREPGFNVIHCKDGRDALARAQDQRFDLAILDVNMPGIDGFDLLARLREIPRYARLPIAMLTSLGNEKDIVRGLELGADDYIVKPFSPAELIARVRRLLGRAAARS